MKYETISLPVHYRDKLQNDNQIPRLTTYLLDNYESLDPNRIRPLVIICPGGGYDHLSAREAEAIAIRFNNMGFQAVLLWYSLAPMEFPAAVCDLAEAVYYARTHADDWHIDVQKIICCGFSAGGHLCATLGCYWNTDLLSDYLPYKSEEIKPNALILSYPVITADEHFCHKKSINLVLGSTKKFSRNDVSLEFHVTSNFPPTFLWHTVADVSVPAENSLLFANALRRAGVPFEYHLFNRGKHGLGLATAETSKPDGYAIEPECAVWTELFLNWWKGIK
ncbi:MAG: alpha/beta hydrolase [Treponema sp.]|nr:alpha/beta hydrolase [Treponema sp.]